MGDVPQVEAVVTAQPLTPELEREMRSGNLTPEIRTVWATLDQARARIAELEGTAQEVQSLATNYKRVRAGLVALEVERLMIVQKDLIRQIERMQPVIEAAIAVYDSSGSDHFTALYLAVDAYRAGEQPSDRFRPAPYPEQP